MGDMHQPSRKKRSQKSKNRKSNNNSESDSSYHKSDKGSSVIKDDLLPVRDGLPYNDPGLPPMPPIRGHSSYNGVRSGSFNSFGVTQYSVPGLTFAPCNGTLPCNQGHYESTSIYLPYQIQDTNNICFNKDGKDSRVIRMSFT